MRARSLSHLGNRDLLDQVAAIVRRDCISTADLLMYLGEIDARRLYLPEGHPSLYSYCIRELHLSEDAAAKRIQAARAARRFPGILDAVADGHLHLGGVCLIAPHLASANSGELIESAKHKTKAEIVELLARRFPGTEALQWVQVLPASVPPHTPDNPARISQQPGVVPEGLASQGATPPANETDLGRAQVRPSQEPLPPGPQHAPGHVPHLAPTSKVVPVAAGRFLLQLNLGRSTYDLLKYAQQLLSHQLPSGDVSEVIDRALKVLVPILEKSKFAATARPRANRRPAPATGKRYVPNAVKRAVWARDDGRCTFVSASGKRCPAREFLEFDHVDPVARGGKATEETVRLRCRAHNQYEAERAYGSGFMEEKRSRARGTAQARRAGASEALAGSVKSGRRTPSRAEAGAAPHP